MTECLICKLEKPDDWIPHPGDARCQITNSDLSAECYRQGYDRVIAERDAAQKLCGELAAAYDRAIEAVNPTVTLHSMRRGGADPLSPEHRQQITEAHAVRARVPKEWI